MAESQPMTEAMYYILLSLENPVHGYGMMQRIRELSHDRVKMGPGTLYGVLTRMRNDGWIEQIQAEGDPRRKTYLLTELGRQELKAEYRRLKQLVSDGAFLEESV
jgi:DNA-binding PadR family transcriptional regulator